LNMNKQEAFDTACRGIIAQGKKSADETGSCLYRSKDGCKCAIGHLIPDEEYEPRMENKMIISYFTWIKSLNEIRKSENGELFLHELQRAHDKCYYDQIAKSRS
jgi:hypothetical protein